MNSVGTYCCTAKESRRLKNKVMHSVFIPYKLLTQKPNETYIFTKSRNLKQKSSREQEQIKLRNVPFPVLGSAELAAG